MDHIITSIDQVQVGDKLSIQSNRFVNDTNPKGIIASFLVFAFVPTELEQRLRAEAGVTRPDVASIMNDPYAPLARTPYPPEIPAFADSLPGWRSDLCRRIAFRVYTMSTLNVIAKTPLYIMMDISDRNTFGPIDHRENVIFRNSDFQDNFLQQSDWSCYKKYTNNPRSLVHEALRGENPKEYMNPRRPTPGEEEIPFNPSGHIGTNKYLVSRVY